MRLDLIISERMGVSRTRAQNIIKTGGVKVDGVTVNKPSADVDPEREIIVNDTLKYTSLGGLKMENALEYFSLSLEGKVCLDIGAANGGFTDCLLKRGAKEVSALDLNIAFPEELLHDSRVRVYDKVNVRSAGKILPTDNYDLICVDLSFISLCGLMELFYRLLMDKGYLLVLFKPQFEVGRNYLPKSGVVRDKKAMERAFVAVVSAAQSAGFEIIGHCPVPDVFPDKNKERTILFIKKLH